MHGHPQYIYSTCIAYDPGYCMSGSSSDGTKMEPVAFQFGTSGPICAPCGRRYYCITYVRKLVASLMSAHATSEEIIRHCHYSFLVVCR